MAPTTEPPPFSMLLQNRGVTRFATMRAPPTSNRSGRQRGARRTAASAGEEDQQPQYQGKMAPRGEGLDAMMDYITAGPKMRKWYGQTDDPLPLRDGRTTPPQPEPRGGPNDAVLVTDADSPLGEQVVLQLILLGAKIRVLVKDVAAAKRAYADYVTPVEGGADSLRALQRALAGARTVILPGSVGELPAALAAGASPNHVVLLSSAGSNRGGLFSGFGPDAVLRDGSREAAVRSLGVAFTIVKAGRVLDRPGGSEELRCVVGGGASGDISREDLGRVAAAVALAKPQGALMFEVVSAGPGEPPRDWGAVLSELVAASA